MLDRLREWLQGRSGGAGTQVTARADAPASVNRGVIKTAPIKIDGRCMDVTQFVAHVEGLDFPDGLPRRIFLHHTWNPTRATWAGYNSLGAIKAYYESLRWRDSRGYMHEGWTAGPHLFIADDGIWLFTDLREAGIGVAGHNTGSLHVEMVGNYNRRLPDGATLKNTVAALGIVHERIGLDVSRLNFHRDFSTKSCPGSFVTKQWIIPMVSHWVAEYRAAKVAKRPTLRRVLTTLAEDLLTMPDDDALLAGQGERRGYLGTITKEIPIEIGDRAYVVQLYAEALVAPTNQPDEVETLAEFERRPEEHPGVSLASDDVQGMPTQDAVDPPVDVVEFDEEIR